MDITPGMADRAAGTLLGMAVGDALGAGYEFAAPVNAHDVVMLPGRLTGRPAGHWTDDTDMAMAIALAAQRYGTLATPEAVTCVAENFLAWFASHPPDVGMQTRAVLVGTHDAARMSEAAVRYQAQRPDAAGNGSLMRTAPVALADIYDLDAVAQAAQEISSLTHPHDDAIDACVLWSVATALGIGGSPSVRESMEIAMIFINTDRQEKWRKILIDAEECAIEDLAPNGWVVRALQASWRAALTAEHSSQDHAFEVGVRFAVSLGDDTDTIAAIAGGLLGAHYGVSTIPPEWRENLSGWPAGYGEQQLTQLAVSLVAAAN